jgi:hypothetical protein
MMLQRLHSEDSDLMERIANGDWDDSIEERLGNCIAEAIDDFGPDFDAEGNPIEEGESDRILAREEREEQARAGEGAGDDGGDGGAPTREARRAEAGEDESVQEAPEQESAPA